VVFYDCVDSDCPFGPFGPPLLGRPETAGSRKVPKDPIRGAGASGLDKERRLKPALQAEARATTRGLKSGLSEGMAVPVQDIVVKRVNIRDAKTNLSRYLAELTPDQTLVAIVIGRWRKCDCFVKGNSWFLIHSSSLCPTRFGKPFGADEDSRRHLPG
jgi:hypothetical protein